MKELLSVCLLFCGIAAVAAYSLTPASVDSLIQDLESSDTAVRRAAVEKLGSEWNNDKAERAIPALKRALNDEDFAIRVLAGVSLSKLGVKDGEVPISPLEAPRLINALSDHNYDVVQSAREGLEQTGAIALPLLIEALETENSNVRDSLYYLLRNLGPEAAGATDKLARILADENPSRDRYGAMVTLGKIGPSARAAVPVLVEVLKMGDEFDRRHALTALAGIGPSAKAAVPAITEARNDDDIGVRSNAERALKAINPNSVPETESHRRSIRRRSR